MKLSTLAPRVNATPEEAELAAVALERTVDVMLGRIHSQQMHGVLSAANRLRDSICGPIAQKHEVEAKGGFTLNVKVASAEKKDDDG